MTIIPSIDILDGKCVRLIQGDYDRVTVYHDDVVSVAARYADLGAARIHLVDLDAARSARVGSEPDTASVRTNRAVIAAIRAAVPAMLEVGGGVRSDEDVAALIDSGVDRIVVGTALIRQPDLVAGWIRTHGPRFVAGIDARDGMVRISGWEQATAVSDADAGRRARDIGMVSIVYTNISRDGMLTGPDIDSTVRVGRAARLPVILSGGIGSNDDVIRVAENGGDAVRGVIIGKALYENRVDLEALLRRFPAEPTALDGASPADGRASADRRARADDSRQ